MKDGIFSNWDSPLANFETQTGAYLLDPNQTYGERWKNAHTSKSLLPTEIEDYNLNALQAKISRDWQEHMSNTAFQRQVADMRAAGVNPALMYASGSDGASTPSGATASGDFGQTPFGSGFGNIVSALMLPAQMAQAVANIANTKASTDQLKAQTEGQKLDNQFNRSTLQTRIKSVELANNLTESQINYVNTNREQISQNIKKLVAETASEESRNVLIKFESNLKDAQAKQIVALLPFQELLIKAQTEGQKASACVSYMNALYQQKLMDKGMIEAQIDSVYKHSDAALRSAKAAQTSAAAAMKNAETASFKANSEVNLNKANTAASFAQSRKANADAALSEFKSMVFNGEMFDSSTGTISDLPAGFLNGLTSALSGIATSIGGPLSGLL